MLRWMTPFLVAIFAIGTAAAQSPDATKPADSPATAKPAESPAAVESATAKRAGNPPAPRRATDVAPAQQPPGLPRTH